MAWDITTPLSSENIIDLPDKFQAHWSVMENWWSQQHYSFGACASATSSSLEGRHRPGFVCVVCADHTSALMAMSATSTDFAIAQDTCACGVYKFYMASGGAAFCACSAMSATGWFPIDYLPTAYVRASADDDISGDYYTYWYRFGDSDMAFGNIPGGALEEKDVLSNYNGQAYPNSALEILPPEEDFTMYTSHRTAYGTIFDAPDDGVYLFTMNVSLSSTRAKYYGISVTEYTNATSSYRTQTIGTIKMSASYTESIALAGPQLFTMYLSKGARARFFLWSTDFLDSPTDLCYLPSATNWFDAIRIA